MADPARLPDPLRLGVQPQLRVGARKGSLAEYGDRFVQAAAQPADGVLAHRLQPQLLDQPVDLAGRDAVDPGLLHDRDQRLLGPPARLQNARELRPGPQLGMASSSSPTRVSQARGREPLRWAWRRSGHAHPARRRSARRPRPSRVSVSSILGQTDDHEARGGRLLLRLGQPRGLATPPSATRPLLGGRDDWLLRR
jgi:hypothetical protein